ncbi:hypothetical protein ACSBR1_005544 [Camellia fascicularis]
MTEPWLVARDFNDFSTTQEKRSFNGNHNLNQSQDQRRSRKFNERMHHCNLMDHNLNQSQDQRRSRKFNERMHHCNLMDLGCSGPRLT